MKKAFDQNVSRAKPRLRLGATFTAPTGEETATVPASPEPADDIQAYHFEAEESVRVEDAADAAPDLAAEMRARIERARQPPLPIAEALERALAEPAPVRETVHTETVRTETETVRQRAVTEPPRARATAPVEPARTAPRSLAEPPPPAVEVQTPSRPVRTTEEDHRDRREKLRERLKAARENPRPEPLPPTVQAAGVLAVERISSLQTELHRFKVLNLALTQDLEAARRQAERATEEARLRMEEAQRLSTEMEARVSLLKDLERELGSIEGERDEALLALTESRQSMLTAAQERETMLMEMGKRDQALADSLAEEERLAGDLEDTQDEARALRETLDTLSTERNTLARQVADLTAERAELLDARKALEAVHRALSHVTSR